MSQNVPRYKQFLYYELWLARPSQWPTSYFARDFISHQNFGTPEQRIPWKFSVGKTLAERFAAVDPHLLLVPPFPLPECPGVQAASGDSGPGMVGSSAGAFCSRNTRAPAARARRLVPHPQRSPCGENLQHLYARNPTPFVSSWLEEPIRLVAAGQLGGQASN